VVHAFPGYTSDTTSEPVKFPIVFFVPGWSGPPHNSIFIAAENFLHKVRRS
jgi:hypothetical protein